MPTKPPTAFEKMRANRQKLVVIAERVSQDLEAKLRVNCAAAARGMHQPYRPDGSRRPVGEVHA